MSVYVDFGLTFDAPPVPGQRAKTWYHLWADSEAELHTFADKIGLRRSWFQGPPEHRLIHYDITSKLRPAALANGAIEIEYVEWLKDKRKEMIR